MTPYTPGSVTVSGTATTTPDAYHGSLFGGTRAHADLAVLERLHRYPGLATAYDTDTYGFDADAGPVGSAAHVPATGCIRLALADGTVGGKARLRTHDHVRYQPGCMPVVQATGCATAGMVGAVLQCVRRSSATGVVVDTVEATITGYTPAMEHRYELRYAYLGVQTAQWWIDGALAHTRVYAGALALPYMSDATLPVSVEVETVGAAEQVVRIGALDDEDGLFFRWVTATPAAVQWDYKCASARLVGGSEYPYKAFTFSRATTGVAATLVPLWSMRVNATLGGIASKVQVFPSSVSFFSESQPGALALVINATLTGATYAATSPSAAVAIDTAATVIAGGTEVFRVGQGANQSIAWDLRDLFTVLDRKLRLQAYTGTSDTLTFAVVREGAVSFDPRVTCTWRELR